MPEFVMFLIFSIPIIAIVGGISMALARMVSQHRLLELAQKERIAMIERGADPAKLPPPPDLSSAGGWSGQELINRPFAEVSRRRAQNMTIGGLVLLFLGLGLGAALYFLTSDRTPAAIGLIPGSLGVALLLGGWIVGRDAAGNGSRPGAGSGTPGN